MMLIKKGVYRAPPSFQRLRRLKLFKHSQRGRFSMMSIYSKSLRSEFYIHECDGIVGVPVLLN